MIAGQRLGFGMLRTPHHMVLRHHYGSVRTHRAYRKQGPSNVDVALQPLSHTRRANGIPPAYTPVRVLYRLVPAFYRAVALARRTVTFLLDTA